MSMEASETITVLLPRWKALGLASKPVQTSVRLVYHSVAGFRCERLDGSSVPMTDLERADPQRVMDAKMRLIRDLGTRQKISSSYVRRDQRRDDRTPRPKSAESAALEPIRDQRRPTSTQRLVREDKGTVAFRLAALREQERRRAQMGPNDIEVEYVEDEAIPFDVTVPGDVPVPTETPARPRAADGTPEEPDPTLRADPVILMPVLQKPPVADPAKRSTTSFFRDDPEAQAKLRAIRESTRSIRRQTPPSSDGQG